ncbi:MAG TPA: hypothetical protein VGC42_26845 [Kofleriaceae bacterium]
MPGPYRALTADQRADHFETLVLLGRLVIAMPPHPLMRRTFVVFAAS